jgi:hypothetical protein
VPIASGQGNPSGTVGGGGDVVARGLAVVEVAVAPCLVPLEQDRVIVEATDTINADRYK